MGRGFGGWGEDGTRGGEKVAGKNVTAGIVWNVLSFEGLDASKEGR